MATHSSANRAHYACDHSLRPRSRITGGFQTANLGAETFGRSACGVAGSTTPSSALEPGKTELRGDERLSTLFAVPSFLLRQCNICDRAMDISKPPSASAGPSHKRVTCQFHPRKEQLHLQLPSSARASACILDPRLEADRLLVIEQESGVRTNRSGIESARNTANPVHTKTRGETAFHVKSGSPTSLVPLFVDRGRSYASISNGPTTLTPNFSLTTCMSMRLSPTSALKRSTSSMPPGVQVTKMRSGEVEGLPQA
jgi:hypothetical protein